MIIPQLSVFLENKSGRLTEALEVPGIKVTLVEPRMIERSEGKSQRVVDKRKF